MSEKRRHEIERILHEGANLSELIVHLRKAQALARQVGLKEMAAALLDLTDELEGAEERQRREGQAPRAERWVSVYVAAGALGRSPDTIRKWVKTGELRGQRMVRDDGIPANPVLHVELNEALALHKAKRGTPS